MIQNIPSEPGCYLFKNNKGKIIYVGKAKNLKKRVSSYFLKKDHDEKTKSLVSHIDSVDFIVTDSEIEALILENTLIKKHWPKYNIMLKDAKGYSYLEITSEKYPRLLTARKKEGKGKFFGPYVSGTEREIARVALVKMFRIRTCNKMPKRPCLRYHIKLCDGPCKENISEAEYSEKLKKISMILKGKSKELLGQLKKDMNNKSNSQDFEKALEIRNQINAIGYLDERQKMQRERAYNEDIINYIIKEGKVYLLLFNIYKGTLENKSEFVFDQMDGFLDSFITQYYEENDVPKEVIVPSTVSSVIKEYLERKRKSKVRVIVPKIGEKKKLLELVEKNVELSFFGDISKCEELQTGLRLPDTPYVIECFDISHLSGTSTVGSMVQFRNGKPDKTNYRRFKIKTVSGVDDFASIAEVVHRRYKRLKEENESFPDLIIIDGGKGQLSAAVSEMKELGVKIPTISLAKKLEEVFVPGMSIPIRLEHKTKALRFLQEIRDEAHRFAIKYNRLLRGKTQLGKK